MTAAQTAITAALVVDLGYGMLVYLTNPRRNVNQQFLVLTLALSWWLGSVLTALQARTPQEAQFWITMCFAATTCLPSAFNLVRMAIRYPEESAGRLLFRSRWIFLASLCFVAVCFSPHFITGVTMATPEAAAKIVTQPVYGFMFPLWNVYFIVFIFALIAAFIRDLRTARGIQKVEIQFVVLGAAVSLLTGVVLAILIPMLTGTFTTAPFAPISVIVLNAIVAYGIVTRRIMGVAVILQKITAYALLIAYLSGVYAVVLGGSQWLLRALDYAPRELPHLLATLVTAFSIIPAHVWFLKLALRLFGDSGAPNIAALVQKAGAILRSITTLDDLFRRFAPLVQESLAAETVAVYLANGDGYARHYPTVTDSRNAHLGVQDPLVRVLINSREPIVLESLSRRRATPGITAAARHLTGLDARAGIGFYSKDELTGIILLGARRTGRIYGAAEQEALQILCNQLGVAVENAKLYTQAQDSRLYNDILVDSLVSGVIAVSRDHKITVLNREAQRILKLPAVSAISHGLDVLPAPLREVLQRTLDSGKGTDAHEMGIVLSPEETVHVRLDSAIFRGHTGDILGALLVLHDITAIKQLQEQIRRSDRLASMGTLSAGMAHEIKNPLVTIRTFTQLLPERYDDPEFRGTFLALVCDEVKRIDAIVNQLLRFSRPSKPKLDVMCVHAALDNSLRLVNEEFRRKQITVTRDYADASDVIVGDADLLSQAFVNFFLNSQEAMHDGGTLTVSTRPCSTLSRPRTWGEAANTRQSLRIEIADTGEGIKEADVARIFDPFFTTKSQGTGLGLTVSHGIIQDHGGVINVKSVVGQGTTLIIDLPCSAQKEPHE